MRTSWYTKESQEMSKFQEKIEKVSEEIQEKDGQEKEGQEKPEKEVQRPKRRWQFHPNTEWLRADFRSIRIRTEHPHIFS